MYWKVANLYRLSKDFPKSNEFYDKALEISMQISKSKFADLRMIKINMSKLFNSIQANNLDHSINILRRITEMNKSLYKNYNSYEVGHALKY